MDETQAKIKTWTELIQSGKLEDASVDIQTSIRVRPSSKLNNDIFKLLLHLCRAADKCHKQHCEAGKGVAKLAKLLCSLLTEVPDDNNFVKALFKIVRCLISLNLHDDAAEICCYLQPGGLYNPRDDTMNLLTKVLSLWQISINNLTAEPLSAENYNKLKSVLGYEIKMVQIAHKNYTNYLITEISKYLDRLVAIDKNKTYFDDFYKCALKHLSGVQLHLDEDDKYVIYCHILRIICNIVCRTVDASGIESAMKPLEEQFSYFEALLAEDEECQQCFRQFRVLCTTLLVPMEGIVGDSAKSIRSIVDCDSNVARKYGCAGGLRWNAISAAEIFEPVLAYWEKRVDADKSTLERLLDTDVLLELMNLFVHMNRNEFYSQHVSVKCKSCLGKLCTVKRDLYNALVMKCRLVSLACKFPVKTLPAKVCAVARKIMRRNVEWVIREMKESECKRWRQSWNTCRNLTYNVGILSEHVYEESVSLFTFLCSCISQLDGVEPSPTDSESFRNLENIISFVLDRLSVVYYSNNLYRKAATVCALNALLTYNQSNTKAFRRWVHIKKITPKEVASLSMLECLTSNEDEIMSELGLSIDVSKYDVTALCLREVKSLLEEQVAFENGVAAVLEKLRKLQPSDQYAHTVQLLGYYFLGFNYASSILECHEQAIHDLKQKKSNSVAVLCLEANLSLFTFAENLRVMIKQTQLEIESTTFALCAPKLRDLVENKSPNVVPAYTMINVKKDTNLKLYLQNCLKKWKQLFSRYFKRIVKDWEPKLILCMLITAGEYARLYRYEDCEAEIWTLAYKLALETNDHTIIYITSRCISLRQIDYDWITTAREHVAKYRDSKDGDVIATIATFWISLADIYFECGKYADAKQLLAEARSLPGISFLGNKSVYLLSLDAIIRNSHFYNMQHEDYCSHVEETRLAMRSLNQDLLKEKWANQVTYLFSYDVVFTTAVNLSMRINSLLSFRGISPDLVRLLKSAQSLNVMLRTAELLKLLCYIDLSRLQLDDCEVKLQGLEHMLNIETFQLSMESKPVEIPVSHLAVTPTRIADPVRDAPQHDASPVLGKKVFDLPKFTLHRDCDCYKCGNVSYQYMVFVTTCVRAQLYALQNHTAAALDHFHGAFEIRRRLFEEEKSVLPENWPRDEVGAKRFSWQIHFYITDYIQLLIDFCYFLKTKMASRQEDVRDIINLAINVCRKYQLKEHPVYKMAEELALDHEFQLALESSDFRLKFVVPQPHDIDVSDHAKTSIDPSVCVTPSVQNRRAKRPASIRRRKSPIALKTKLNKINLIWSDDEDDDSLSPPATYSNRKCKSYTNLVNRKILEEDLVDDINLDVEDSVSKQTKLENANEDRNSTQRKSTKDIMIEVTSSVPDVSKSLMNLVDKTNLPATTENIDKLIESIENLKIKSKTRKSVRDTKQLTVADYNKNIDQAIELLKDMAIKERTSENIDSSTPTKLENIDKLQNHKVPNMHNERKFFKTRTLKEKLEKSTSNTLLTNESKTSRSKCPKLLLNDEAVDTRTTRSSDRRCKKQNPS
ncbi:PREDICTED: uncharacterized protein LOC105558076 [Vollenhovia emeryi]|uniref:uncharacterized protein LOC105558076 n=1 Tax=Vollenhovia emeryi TaxID=411798 RepID=UPI0005F446ED|nr:PREDICTED: uncharacterized protein LOC105558076 [Vollenhovia emeryi]